MGLKASVLPTWDGWRAGSFADRGAGCPRKAHRVGYEEGAGIWVPAAAAFGAEQNTVPERSEGRAAKTGYACHLAGVGIQGGMRPGDILRSDVDSEYPGRRAEVTNGLHCSPAGMPYAAGQPEAPRHVEMSKSAAG